MVINEIIRKKVKICKLVLKWFFVKIFKKSKVVEKYG